MTTAELIAYFEGFSAKPYWDVNAWRIGYGSDTEGPSQFRVTKGMPPTTRERALQNLALRVPEFQRIVINAIGPGGWDRLKPYEQSALTSVAYNYGRVPFKVDLDNPHITATRIKALRTHNKGINASRRDQEANFYLTGQLKAKTMSPTVAIGTIGTSGVGAQLWFGNYKIFLAFAAITLVLLFLARPKKPFSPLERALMEKEKAELALIKATARISACKGELQDKISSLQAELTEAVPSKEFVMEGSPIALIQSRTFWSALVTLGFLAWNALGHDTKGMDSGAVVDKIMQVIETMGPFISTLATMYFRFIAQGNVTGVVKAK
jgi:GH24 family phage-related lysozyme (muramidase)